MPWVSSKVNSNHHHHIRNMKSLKQYRHFRSLLPYSHSSKEANSLNADLDWKQLPIAHIPGSVVSVSPSSSYLAVVGIDGLCQIYYIDSVITRIAVFSIREEYNSDCLSVNWSSDSKRICFLLNKRHADDPSYIVYWDLQHMKKLAEILLSTDVISVRLKLTCHSNQILLVDHKKCTIVNILNLQYVSCNLEGGKFIEFSSLGENGKFRLVSNTKYNLDLDEPTSNFKWSIILPYYNGASETNIEYLCGTENETSNVIVLFAVSVSDELGRCRLNRTECYRGEENVLVQRTALSADKLELLILFQAVINKKSFVLVFDLATSIVKQVISTDFFGNILGVGYLPKIDLSTDIRSSTSFCVFIQSSIELSQSKQPTLKLRRHAVDSGKYVMATYISDSVKYMSSSSVAAIPAVDFLSSCCTVFQCRHHAFLAVTNSGIFSLSSKESSTFAGSMYPPGFQILQEPIDHKETESELDYNVNGKKIESVSRDYKPAVRLLYRTSSPQLLPIFPSAPTMQSSTPLEKTAVLASRVQQSLDTSNNVFALPVQFLNHKRTFNGALPEQRNSPMKKMIANQDIFLAIKRDVFEGARKFMERKGKRKVARVMAANKAIVDNVEINATVSVAENESSHIQIGPQEETVIAII